MGACKNNGAMMRKSVSHLSQTLHITGLSSKIRFLALVSVGVLTVLTGIGVLIALMNPHGLQTAPTVALVCVLVLLCVPVPVLMLERRAGVARHAPEKENKILRQHSVREPVIHGAHMPHDSKSVLHRTKPDSNEKTVPTRTRLVS